MWWNVIELGQLNSLTEIDFFMLVELKLKHLTGK